jgi:di/tricarboxylate transporter
MMTLIASSPNMIIENTLRGHGLHPLGFFSWTPFGLAVLVTCIGFMLTVGRRLLSRQRTARDEETELPSVFDLIGAYDLSKRWHRLRVPSGSPLGQPPFTWPTIM